MKYMKSYLNGRWPHEAAQILGMGDGCMPCHVVLHRKETQIIEERKVTVQNRYKGREK